MNRRKSNDLQNYTSQLTTEEQVIEIGVIEYAINQIVMPCIQCRCEDSLEVIKISKDLHYNLYAKNSKLLESEGSWGGHFSVICECKQCKEFAIYKFKATHHQFEEIRGIKNEITQLIDYYGDKLVVTAFSAESIKAIADEYLCDSNRAFPSVDTQLYLIDKEIGEISPQFIQIYNQANRAEQEGLDQICGAGYRKALEFLIKDYAIHEEPDNKENIKSAFLGNCISKYIQDEKINSVMTRATWLGNDEVHYIRVWNDKDLQDLKKLIFLTIKWIKYNMETMKYINSMDNSNPLAN